MGHQAGCRDVPNKQVSIRRSVKTPGRAHLQAHKFRPKNDHRNLVGERQPAKHDSQEPAKQLWQREQQPEGTRAARDMKDAAAKRKKYKGGI